MTSNVTGYRVGADIGGTFTDLVLIVPGGAVRTAKVLSTPDDYARGIIDGLTLLFENIDVSIREVEDVVHGTTVATNAILENRGARTGLLTTQGFRDVLELRRLRVPSLYDLRFRPPPPMVERALRLEVRERVGPEGQVLEALDDASVRSAVDRLRNEGVQAVAVCLLHSYRNPAHERRVGQIVTEAMPNAFLSLSIDVLPEIREYERTSTTVINAFVGPVVQRYLRSLVKRLAAAGISGRLSVMQSSGGVMSAAAAMRRPAAMVESGPAAGVVAARSLGQRSGRTNLVTFDMGGTTAKASLIEDGAASLTTEYEVGAGISLSSRLVKGGGHALKLPVLDIAEVGAGGGSVIWVDRGGALKVGPRSMGASPGPACYGLGGTVPTITDANLLLGYLNPDSLAGGVLPLSADRAEAAMAEIGTELGMDPHQVAAGAHAVANATMIRAIKAVTTYRGRDPRDFALLAFGGSGPVHAVGVAIELGIKKVIVPANSGVFSAVGLLEAPPEHHFVQTFVSDVRDVDFEALLGSFVAMERRARTTLASEGYSPDTGTYRRSVDCRYVGQAYELTVALPDEELSEALLADMADAFGSEHERVYGHRAASEPVEIVNLRLVATVPGASLPGEYAAPLPGPTTERIAHFGGVSVLTPVLGRGLLSLEVTHGPIIIEDPDSTLVVPPGWGACLENGGAVLVEAIVVGV